jgi:hypothetical protein
MDDFHARKNVPLRAWAGLFFQKLGLLKRGRAKFKRSTAPSQRPSVTGCTRKAKTRQA